MIKKTIHLGDKIITTKKFPYGAGKKATIIRQRDESYGAEFDEPIEMIDDILRGSHYLDNTLIEKKGYYLEPTEFKIIESYSNKNKNKEEYIHLLKKEYYIQKGLIPQHIKSYEANIEYNKHDIQNSQKNIKRYEKNIKTTKKDIEKTKEIKELNISNLENEFDKLIKHKLIKDITIDINNEIQYIIVTTNDLTYHNPKTIPDFVLGAYKIFIPLNSDTIRIINYKKQMMQGAYFHPCIERDRTCFGARIKDEVTQYKQRKQYTLLIFLIINFLCEPNEDGPYIPAKTFSLAQPVTIKPKNIFNYLSNAYWDENEKWDDNKYQSQRKEIGLDSEEDEDEDESSF